MGIETTNPDVEETTEPPICPFTESISHSPATAVSLSWEQCDTNEKQSADSRVSRSLSSTTRQHALREFPGGSEDHVQNAHLFEPCDLAALLQTDLQYVNDPPRPERSLLIKYYFSNGLSIAEADLRLKRDGPNAVRDFKGISIWGILLRQVSNSLTIVSLQSDTRSQSERYTEIPPRYYSSPWACPLESMIT